MYIDTSGRPDNYWKLCIQKQSSCGSTTVKKLNKNTFEKTQSDVITKVYVTSKEQYEDTKNFPVGTGHKLYLKDDSVWTADDFTYGEESFGLWPADQYSTIKNFTVHVVTGFSEQGLEKIKVNKNLVIPAKDSDGKKRKSAMCGFIFPRCTVTTKNKNR